MSCLPDFQKKVVKDLLEASRRGAPLSDELFPEWVLMLALMFSIEGEKDLSTVCQQHFMEAEKECGTDFNVFKYLERILPNGDQKRHFLLKLAESYEALDPTIQDIPFFESVKGAMDVCVALRLAEPQEIPESIEKSAVAFMKKIAAHRWEGKKQSVERVAQKLKRLGKELAEELWAEVMANQDLTLEILKKAALNIQKLGAPLDLQRRAWQKVIDAVDERMKAENFDPSEEGDRWFDNEDEETADFARENYEFAKKLYESQGQKIKNLAEKELWLLERQ